jgi:uncharacterized protein YraI
VLIPIMFALFLILGSRQHAFVHAQATSDRTPTVTINSLTPVDPLTPVATASITPTQRLRDTSTPTAITTLEVTTPAPTPTVGPPRVELRETEVLTGTIIANRTGVNLTFFLEGRLYELSPLRSTGVLPSQILTTLVLYNCGIDERIAGPDCFWDPYLVRQDGFYEIVNNAERGAPVSLLLQEAGSPPTDQIWIQNRTGHNERILYNDELYELNNAHILEVTLDDVNESSRLAGAADKVGVIYVRRCLGIGLRSVCEWLPTHVISGVYYALLEDTVAGPYTDSASTYISLKAVIGEERLALLTTPTPEPAPEPVLVSASQPVQDAPAPQAIDATTCQIQVPVLNVRSGPGLDYAVLDQILQTDPSRGRVEVSGRDNANSWLSVQESVVAGGWIINQREYVICDDATASLPVAQVVDRAVTAPAPVTTPVQETPPVQTVEGVVACQLQSPVLNVRAGPGLEYLVIGQIRQTDAHRGRITIAGRDAASGWLSVQESLVAGGWIINQAAFVRCDAATASLPVAQVTDGRLTPSEPASPAVAAPPTPLAAATSDTLPTSEPVAEEAVAQAPEIPDSRTLLIVTNAFEHEIRFTLDAREHGLPSNAPSEYDLAVGQSLQFEVRAGRVRFSASSPFRNSSGNAEFLIDQGQSRVLALHFIPAGSSDQWELRY